MNRVVSGSGVVLLVQLILAAILTLVLFIGITTKGRGVKWLKYSYGGTLVVVAIYVVATSLACSSFFRTFYGGYAAPVSALEVGKSYPLLAVKSDGGRSFALVMEPPASGKEGKMKTEEEMALRLIDLTIGLPERCQLSISFTNNTRYLTIKEDKQ